jgi:hypothetical protein
MDIRQVWVPLLALPLGQHPLGYCPKGGPHCTKVQTDARRCGRRMIYKINMSGARTRKKQKHARPDGREKGPSVPKGAPREGTYRPVSNGPVAEHGPRPVAWPLARMRACSPTASAHARDANRRRACAACLCPSGESRQALLRTRQPRSGRMPSDPVPAGAPERPTAATICCERYAGKCNAARGNATQCMSRWVASAADLNVACTGVGILINERDRA